MIITKDYEMKQKYNKVLESLKGKVLDIGCHHAIFDIKAILNDFDVTGIDISNKYLDIARQNALDSNVSINLINCNIDNLPKDTKYDTILLMDIIEHLEDPKQGILNALELLNENGQIIITTPVGFCHYAPDHVNFFFEPQLYNALNYTWAIHMIPTMILNVSKIINTQGFLKDLGYKYTCEMYEYGDSKVQSLDYYITITR